MDSLNISVDSLDGLLCLSLKAEENEVFQLTQAYKFLYVADGSADPHSLVGKIFTKDQLEKSNMDIYMDSVLYQEKAYQVESGYIGIPQNKAAEVESQNWEQIPDEDLLSDYLLKVL